MDRATAKEFEIVRIELDSLDGVIHPDTHRMLSEAFDHFKNEIGDYDDEKRLLFDKIRELNGQIGGLEDRISEMQDEINELSNQ